MQLVVSAATVQDGVTNELGDFWLPEVYGTEAAAVQQTVHRQKRPGSVREADEISTETGCRRGRLPHSLVIFLVGA